MPETEIEQLRCFDVTNKHTGEKVSRIATDAIDAAEQAGWQIDDCYIIPQMPRYVVDHKDQIKILVRVPAKTCPFQFSDCNLPEGQSCPIHPNAPDLKEWLIQASTAHLCPHYGVELTKADHALSQKWLPIPEAIAALSPKYLSLTENARQ
ncbi:MAG: hypothetical protein PHQ61_08635 [Candidatus Omnitrophica bacterium]|nr:hypothetical protein [Candidatus Omnitrophota bacterium]